MLKGKLYELFYDVEGRRFFCEKQKLQSCPWLYVWFFWYLFKIQHSRLMSKGRLAKLAPAMAAKFPESLRKRGNIHSLWENHRRPRDSADAMWSRGWLRNSTVHTVRSRIVALSLSCWFALS